MIDLKTVRTHVVGKLLSEDEQKRKLERVAETARQVWSRRNGHASRFRGNEPRFNGGAKLNSFRSNATRSCCRTSRAAICRLYRSSCGRPRRQRDRTSPAVWRRSRPPRELQTGPD